MPTSTMVQGDVIDLTVQWGTQRRGKCPTCTRFITLGPIVVCKCGSAYKQVNGTRYTITKLP